MENFIKKRARLFISLLFMLTLGQFEAIDSSTYFVNRANLLGSDQYTLFWNYTSTDITFKVVVKCTGCWIGFGISPTVGMVNSDMIVAYQNQNGTVNFTNRFVSSIKSLPMINPSQHWSMLYYSQQNISTTVIFTRKLVICNTDQSINIVSGSQFVIFAWGTSFNTNNGYTDISYHSATNRSSFSVPLISTLNANVSVNMSQIETKDFIVNGSLANDSDTTYFCQIFKLPDDWLKTKRHLVRYEMIMAPNTSQYVHHLLWYECSLSYENEFNGGQLLPGQCFKDNWLNVLPLCQTISLAWAIGGSIVTDFPSNMAYPLGGPQADFKYFFIEMHYNNPRLEKNVQDYSGIRLYVTQNYRPIEFGVLTVGAVSDSNAILIPPKANLTRLDFYCRNNCSNNLFNSNASNITVIATLPHSHLQGRQIYSKVVRNGTEVAYLSNAKYYDFSHQYVNFLNTPVTIYPNDEIKLTCVYSTLDKADFTFGGITTHDEMV